MGWGVVVVENDESLVDGGCWANNNKDGVVVGAPGGGSLLWLQSGARLLILYTLVVL